MSNISKDHPSIRNNNSGATEFEQSAANKKKQLGSDIFGSKQDNVDPAPVKQNRNTGNNIFGTDPEAANPSAGTLAGQYKQTQMKSNIFGTDEPTSTRTVSDKNKSNIFGIGDKDEQNKRQSHVRQGVRVGYNPINGESYSMKDNVNAKNNEKDKQTAEEEHGNGQAVPTNSAENGSGQATSTNTTEKDHAQKVVEKPDDATNGNNAQKNVHTSVRVFHPPGGKSNGPLW